MVVIIRCRLGRFDLNPLGLQLFLLGNADFENPVAVNGRDGRCIGGAWQSEATVKGPGPALDLAIAFLLIALGCPRALNRQNPVFQRGSSSWISVDGSQSLTVSAFRKPAKPAPNRRFRSP
jgi:hypothetical protein